jgi:fatty-acyl-CoA synthase
VTTVASLIRDRKGDQHAGYIFEGRTYSWDEVVSESAVRASILNELLVADRPPHIGILLENTPDYLFWIGGAALIGACIVGINPTRRGAELERDIQHTDCQIIVSDQNGMSLIDGLHTGVDTNKVIDVDSAQHRDQLLQHRDATLPEHEPDENSILFLLFTSGSTSAPKAVVCTNQRMATASVRAGQIYGVTANEVCYCPMPLFHGNALMACWGPALAVGATLVLRRKFSASNFMSDIRAHQCTYFTYVGRTIAYILGQPESDGDKNNKLRLGFGTEASALDRERFLERFACDLVEGYGSSESVVAIIRTPDTPANALGKERADMAGQVCIIDPDTNIECPRVQFDEFGAIANPECIGEIVSLSGGTSFEGYYNNREASTERVRNGWYWTGDLGYRDDNGFFYFGGRSADWLRVDSENFAAAPVENIVSRFPGVVMAAVYPVPDPTTGDMVMVAIEMNASARFSPTDFDEFLLQQRDLGTKWSPQLVRVTQEMPLTANNKVHKPPLRATKWQTTDEVFWRAERNQPLRLMTPADKNELESRFAVNGRTHILAGP